MQFPQSTVKTWRVNRILYLLYSQWVQIVCIYTLLQSLFLQSGYRKLRQDSDSYPCWGSTFKNFHNWKSYHLDITFKATPPVTSDDVVNIIKCIIIYMSNIKKNFPIFQTHPELVYLDSTATSQKPSHVIDGVAEYLRSSYANIHRGSYEISEISEKLYQDSKQKVADNIWAESWREVIYTGNSTYALNILAQSIWRTGLLKKWDKVLVSIVEHHANIVPWLILKEDYGIELEYIAVNDNFELDYEDFRSKLDDTVKIVSLAHVSNTTGQIFDLENVNSLLNMRYGNDRPLFIVDGSQSVPHFKVDVEKIGCDAMFFTWHKIFADSWIWVLWGKEDVFKRLKPIFSGGGAIWYVRQWEFTSSSELPDKFEPGTPNLSWAVSLLKAFEYIESIWGYSELEQIENDLSAYALKKFEEFEPHLNSSPQGEDETAASLSSKEENLSEGISLMDKSEVKLIGGRDPNTRVWVFSFTVEGIHSFDISDYLADHHICIRAGQHCAEPFMESLGLKHSCRMSLHIYNTREDIDKFFEVLEMAINDLK